MRNLQCFELGNLFHSYNYININLPLVLKFIPSLKVLKLLNVAVEELSNNDLVELVLIGNSINTVEHLSKILIDCPSLLRLTIMNNAVQNDEEFDGLYAVIDYLRSNGLIPALQHLNGESVDEVVCD